MADNTTERVFDGVRLLRSEDVERLRERYAEHTKRAAELALKNGATINPRVAAMQGAIDLNMVE